MQQWQKDWQVMLLGVPVGCRAVHAEANAVKGFSKTLEELKGRVALPRFEINLLSAANRNFLHARMLNRRGLSDGSHGRLHGPVSVPLPIQRFSKTLYQGHLF
jgi:hypothetical protein